MSYKEKAILLLLKIPPPYIGPTIASTIILESKLCERYYTIHLDTSDHRDINTLGKFDLMNVLIAFKQYIQLIFYILKYNPRVIYFPNAQTTIAYLRDIPFIIISKIFRKKVIGHLRGGNFKNWYESAGKLMQFAVRKIHPLFDRQIVLGDCLISMYDGIYPAINISVVPNGRDFEFDPVSRSNIGELKILFLANFHESKGIIDTIKSVEYLKDKQGKVKFFFAGNWRAEETKKEFYAIADTIPRSMIEVVGPVKDKEKEVLFLTADIFIFPTYYHNEGHPWVLVEAMAAGLPIITTDHAAIKETVQDGINGFLVEKRNPRQIAKKMEELINDNNLRKRFGRKSRELYKEKFTEEKFVSNLEKAFNAVL